MKTIKQLEAELITCSCVEKICNRCMRNTAILKDRKDVLGLIDERIEITKQLHRDGFLTQEQLVAKLNTYEELKARITG